MLVRTLFSILALVLISWCGAAQALDAWMAAAGNVLAPAGFRDFCQRDGPACAAPDGSPVIVPVSRRELLALENFNRKYNGYIRYHSDHAVYGVGDYWDIANGVGDCEDIALAKRAALVAAGWPAAALWLAIGRDSAGQAHVVLVLRSDRGDLVLDNRIGPITLWHRTALHWIARQVPGDGLYWRLLDTRP